MDIKLINKDEFTISGIVKETSVENCEKDLRKLWDEYINISTIDKTTGLYGLMWYTQNHNYCYLLGKEIPEPEPDSRFLTKNIPEALYAKVQVPKNLSIMDAWTTFFQEDLPNAGYMPDTEHGLYFEYYPDSDNGVCELWTPAKSLT